MDEPTVLIVFSEEKVPDFLKSDTTWRFILGTGQPISQTRRSRMRRFWKYQIQRPLAQRLHDLAYRMGAACE